MRQNIFSVVQEFFLTKTSIKQALCQLKRGTEIAIVLEGRTPCALFYEGGNVKFEKRPAHDPDLVFTVFPEAARRLSTLEGENMTEMGVEICREIALGSIELDVNGSPTHLIRRGYIKILIEAGPDFLVYLKQSGLEGFSKVAELIQTVTKGK